MNALKNGIWLLNKISATDRHQIKNFITVLGSDLVFNMRQPIASTTNMDNDEIHKHFKEPK